MTGSDAADPECIDGGIIMKHLTLLMACMLILLCALPAQAQIPRLISFQGILTDTNGQPVADGSHDVAFALYENRTTTTPLWRETQSVEVADGLFNVLLGSAVALTIEFDAPYYLGIAVDGDPELQPRTQLAAAPYAMRAVAADRAADADHAARADQADVSSALAPDATGAVTSLNQLTGDIEMVGAGGTSVSTNGGTITITSSGGGGGIVSLHNTDGSISILNPTGPAVTLGLVDGGVTEQKIANLAVTTAKLGNLAVTGSKLADNAVTTTKLAPEAVTTGDIAPAAVTTSKISSAGASAGQVLSYDGSVVAWSTLTAGGVSGSGSAGALALWTGAKVLGSPSELVYDGDHLGVGVYSPEATLHVDGSDGLLAVGAFGLGAMMNLGAGTRMHWYARSAAFRAGRVNGSEWDQINIGRYSVAMGFETIASGQASFAMGLGAEASNNGATAFGQLTKATGQMSTAFGIRTIASGVTSVATGFETEASASFAVAMGANTTASGNQSLAAGTLTEASGVQSVAAGNGARAEGATSFAMGTGCLSSGTNAATFGYRTEASNNSSFAAGSYSEASGINATAFGMTTVADAMYATAMGEETTASGRTSTAMGFDTKARGNYSTAIGYGSVAAGNGSTAIGIDPSAGGRGAVAIGYKTTASGDYSTAMGCYARTTGNNGAFVIGDNSSPTLVSASTANEITLRFAGGYRFYTSANMSTGAFMPPGGSGWANPSDRNMKENITPVNGEEVLANIRRLPVTEWNYIGADPSVRYIGPMAQDFWQAFRLCGTDSLTINSVAIDGVNLAAIKALERRTRELRAATERIAELEARIDVLEQREASASGTSQTVSRTSGTSVPAADVQVFLSRIAELEARLDDIVQEQ